MIHKIFLLITVMSALSVLPASAKSCLPNDNLVAQNSYEVLRKGKPIGTHVISFYGEPGAMKINAKTAMKIEVMFITAFKYSYDSTETYCGDTLESAMTYVDDNGRRQVAEVTRTGAHYLSQSSEGTALLESPFHTSNHWNPDVVQATSILNTATGELEGVSVSADDNQPHVYKVRGDIDYNTHYDANGQWLGMDFDHPKGGAIEFRCVDCKNTPNFALQHYSAQTSLVKYSFEE